MNLGNILKEIETLKPAATVDPLLGPAETVVGRIGMKRQAVEQIKDLKLVYAKALKESSVFIVVTGGARNAFCEALADPDYACFTLDADKFYKDLIATINPTLFGAERTQYLFSAVADALYSRALDLGINSYNYLQFSDKYSAYVKTSAELLPIIRAAINEQVGSEIVGISALHDVVDLAIKRNHTAAITPIVLNVSDEAFALDLRKNLGRLTSKVFMVAAGKSSRNILVENGVVTVKTVSKENVESALESIRSKLST